MLESPPPPEPRRVALFGYRVLIQYDGGPFSEGEFGHRDKCSEGRHCEETQREEAQP